ncbi:PIF1 protein [Hirsutella rhossiliensis]|uniref:PIF1 protein n=1 Tax=Hirsutella rhossiliensis TaxID=111463 RepID=A0A9P8MLP8_9HYPO|nr:PIF1 protein [Hirsutella rhossiliensis]KAH0957632.1 PIF1 protein [Hirsutella rhossiliensis]
MFPDELKGLMLVEEKLVSLNSCYGVPNNVQELATKVLRTPLQALDEIHVSWQGVEKPAPSDLSSLLSETGGEAEGHGPNEEGAGRDGVGASPDQNVRPINEVTSSGMFGLDGPPDVADVESCGLPVTLLAQVPTTAARARELSHTFESRGDEFADSFETSFFARTFPTLFPFGVGDQGAAAGDIVSSRSLNLRIWADIVLRRHGGRFALHHIFAFLVFNMGVRSRNRRVSMLSVARKDFGKVERVARSMTAQRSFSGASRCTATGNPCREVRLNMRRKIQSLIVGYGVPAIWFTINPNDITNPVKLRLAAYRTRDPGAAEEFLEGLGSAYKRTRLAMSDPMSAAVFFHREMKLFFDHYVKLDACRHPREDQAAYRERIIRYVDSVFSEDLDQEGFCAVQAERSVTSDISSLLDNTEQFSAAFDEEANFCAGATQVQGLARPVSRIPWAKERGRNPCRFKSPWRLVDKTAITADGVLQIRRTHSMVNRWNKAIAVGLRHNHDISFIATQRKTMALMYYVTNYATKVEDPVWKRVAAAADLLAASTGDGTANGGQDDGGGAVEVVAHLLGYPAEFTNSSAWAYLNTSLLYWEVFRRWPYLRRASGAAAIDDTLDESVLRRPGKHATVCLDGYLSKDFGHNDDEESPPEGSRAASCAICAVGVLSARRNRISCLVDNVQLLRRSAEDAKRDAKQWAASSGDGDSTVAHVEEGETGEAGAEFAATYRSNNIGDATRLIDVVRGAVGTNQVTAKSPELMAMMRQLCRFQQSALCSTAELEAIAIPEQGLRCISMPGRVFSGAALPPQDQVKAIKSQQITIAELRCGGDDRLREDDVEMTTADSDETASDAEAGMRVQLGPSTSFFAAGKELSTRLTLNKRQSIAFLIICRQLDLMRQTNRGDAGQLCQFVGGEGGTGKSRIIGALVELFSGKSLSNRLLITATSGTAAAQINGITIHSACGFTKDQGRAARTQPRTLTGKISGIPIVLFCGDFQQFRPVQERSIVLPSAAISWDVDNSFKAEQRHQHDKAHALWKRFTTRIRQGVQDRTDLDLLNSRCYREGRRIPWETGITVVTPLNRNRWNLNMEASLAFRVQQRSTMRIFISEHKWKEGLPTEEEAIMVLNQGDDSAIPVPAVFMFVAGMPVIVDKASPGHRISSDMTIHFGPPAGILLESATTKDLHFNDVSRKGLPCAAAFACTDYKVQGRTLERVALELRGTRTTKVDGRAVPSQCDPYSLYVQLSRCRTLDGITLVSRCGRDLVGNRVPEEMTAAQARLEVLSERTVEEALRRSDGDAEESRRVVRVR